MTITKDRCSDSRNYTLGHGTHQLEPTYSEKDLGVIFDHNLKFDDHIQSKIKKANSMMGIIRRTYTYLDQNSFLLLFKSLVRPHLEYANQAWSPHLKKHITSIENVQRRATKQIPGLKTMTYQERLVYLKLPTLCYRRLRGDMIEVFKILTYKYDSSVCAGLLHYSETGTRGHSYKLAKPRANTNIKKYYFTHRVNDLWNSLPENVVGAPSVMSFEARLDKHWSDHPLKYSIDSLTHAQPADL